MPTYATTRRAGAAALAAILAMGAPASAEAPVPAETPLQAASAGMVDPEAEVLALSAERHRRFTIPVMVDGSGPYNFMIDTGSEATVITHEINAGLGLRSAGVAMLVGMASRREVELVEVGRLDLGSHTVTDLAAPLLAREHVGADGIIGLDSLQDFRVLIDFRDQTMTLQDARNTRQGRGGFEIVVRAQPQLGQLLITDAKVEGIRATVIIDTGAQMSLANHALRDRIRAKRAAEVVATDVNGVDLIGAMSVVRSLSIEGLALNDVPLTFADAPAFEALGLSDKPALSLGMQHLALFDRVAIDFARQRVLFDVPRDVARAMRAARMAGQTLRF